MEDYHSKKYKINHLHKTKQKTKSKVFRYKINELQANLFITSKKTYK